MEDVGRVPTEMSPAANLEPTTTHTLDGWIEGLMSCKQLSETDVQRLCEKVSWGSTLWGHPCLAGRCFVFRCFWRCLAGSIFRCSC